VSGAAVIHIDWEAWTATSPKMRKVLGISVFRFEAAHEIPTAKTSPPAEKPVVVGLGAPVVDMLPGLRAWYDEQQKRVRR
jgi:hypothetical protein